LKYSGKKCRKWSYQFKDNFKTAYGKPIPIGCPSLILIHKQRRYRIIMRCFFASCAVFFEAGSVKNRSLSLHFPAKNLAQQRLRLSLPAFQQRRFSLRSQSQLRLRRTLQKIHLSVTLRTVQSSKLVRQLLLHFQERTLIQTQESLHVLMTA